jgi:hypothetical protein
VNCVSFARGESEVRGRIDTSDQKQHGFFAAHTF